MENYPIESQNPALNLKYYNNLCKNFEKQIKLYDLKEFIKDFAILLGFGMVGLALKKVSERFINKRLQYNACIMEFFNNGFDEFIKKAIEETKV